MLVLCSWKAQIQERRIHRQHKRVARRYVRFRARQILCRCVIAWRFHHFKVQTKLQLNSIADKQRLQMLAASWNLAQRNAVIAESCKKVNNLSWAWSTWIERQTFLTGPASMMFHNLWLVFIFLHLDSSFLIFSYRNCKLFPRLITAEDCINGD